MHETGDGNRWLSATRRELMTTFDRVYASLLNFKLLVQRGVGNYSTNRVSPTIAPMERLKEPEDRMTQSSPWTQFLMMSFYHRDNFFWLMLYNDMAESTVRKMCKMSSTAL